MGTQLADRRSSRRPRSLATVIAVAFALLLPTIAAADAHQPPDGFHDIAEGEVNGNDCLAEGWAVDPDSPDARLNVRISLDGTVVGTVVADRFRSDILEAGISDGYSGWGIDLLGLATRDAPQQVLAEAQDAQTGDWFALGASPKLLTCGNATPIGFHDGHEGLVATYDCMAFGWAVDRDDLTARLQVRVLVDGVEAASAIADDLREDLIASGDSPDGLAGFTIDLRDAITPVVPHLVTAQARDHDTGEWFDLEATPRTLRCADDPAANPFIGAWTSTDIDGSTETLVVSGGPAGLRVSYGDDFASVCADADAAVTIFRALGQARLLGPDLLEVSLDDGRCGAHIVPIGWPMTFDYLAGTDQLLGDGERTWSRRGAETPGTPPGG
jgi:hypothetical protein